MVRYFPKMIGKAVWDWICSAPKRPFIQRSYHELVALVNSTDAEDIKTLNKIQEELDYRKRLSPSKREEIRGLIEIKANLIQALPERAAECLREIPTPEIEECQKKDRSKGFEENSKDHRENQCNGYIEEEFASGGEDESQPNKQVEEGFNESTNLENEKASTSQLADTAKEAIDTNGKYQCREIYQPDLSRKTYNALRRNGFEDMSMLQCMSDEEILMLKGIGNKALDEIRAAFPFTEDADRHKSEIEYRLITTKEEVGDNQPHVQDIESEERGEGICKDKLKQEPIQEEQEIDLRDLIMIETFSTHREEIECLNEAVDAARKGLCMVAAIKNEREFGFLLKRMSGMTLEAIGEEAGVTRERVRQVIKKASEKLGIQMSELGSILEERRKKINDSRIRQALDRELQDHQIIGKMTRNEWREVNGKEMSLRDRIDILRELYVPMPANELQDHLTIIEEGGGQYGGTEYWDDILILRLLINMVALNNGKPGIMPRQIEIPRLVSRYIQRRGGQRQVALMLGMSYEGPIGSRNRNYWTDDRISQAIRDTQEYFGLPEDIMPEQSQITVWLDLDDNDDTKGPSCIAAIKKEGGWKDYCDKKGYKQYIDQDDEGKTEIDSMILLSLWNRNSFITRESEFMDVFTEFLGEFWNSQSDPRRYISLVNNACRVAKSIAEYSGVIDMEQRKEIVCKAVDMTPALDGLQPQDDNSDSVDVDRFVDLLF